MRVDKPYFMSSFLSFRYVDDDHALYREDLTHFPFRDPVSEEKILIRNSSDIHYAISNMVADRVDDKTGILLSGGIDSAILASYLKPGTKAYTLQCIAEGATNEAPIAAAYAKQYDLDHRIIEVTWDDYITLMPELMRHQGSPIHSIAPQLLKAIRTAKKDGLDKIISGHRADGLFGGYSRMLSKNWTFEEFSRWYTFVDPERVLKQPVPTSKSFEKFVMPNGHIDVMKFIRYGILGIEGGTSFNNAFVLENMNHLKIYNSMELAEALDIERIRNGESKYFLKELFRARYPNFDIPEKIPLPRAVDQWLQNWKGPVRDEFIPNCINGLSGEQKWLVFSLEMFMNLFEETPRTI